MGKRTGILPLGKVNFTLPYRITEDAPLKIGRHQVGWREHDKQLMFRRVKGLQVVRPGDMEDERFSVQEVLAEDENGVRTKVEMPARVMRQLRNFDEPQALKFMEDVRSGCDGQSP